jgi:uncharacterized protein DUF6894
VPRYHFDMADGRPYCEEEGIDLADDPTAWREAKRLTRDIEGALEPGESWHLEVRDETDIVFRLQRCREPSREQVRARLRELSPALVHPASRV